MGYFSGRIATSSWLLSGKPSRRPDTLYCTNTSAIFYSTDIAFFQYCFWHDNWRQLLTLRGLKAAVSGVNRSSVIFTRYFKRRCIQIRHYL